MANEQDHPHIDSICFGVAGSSVRAVQDELQEKAGILVNRTTIQRIRSGKSGGEATSFFVPGIRALKDEDVIKKNFMYWKVARAIQQCRQQQSKYPARYASRGLTEAVAEKLGGNTRDVREMYTAIRADYLSATAGTKRSRFSLEMHWFKPLYCDRYENKSAPTWQALFDQWDETAEGLYRLLSSLPTGSIMGTIVPTEANWWEQHYGGLIEVADHKPSPFDLEIRELLKPENIDYSRTDIDPSNHRHRFEEEMFKELARKYPLRLNRENIFAHLRALNGSITAKTKNTEKNKQILTDSPLLED